MSKLILDNIAVNENHEYIHDEYGAIKSVTTRLRGGISGGDIPTTSASYGNEVHSGVSGILTKINNKQVLAGFAGLPPAGRQQILADDMLPNAEDNLDVSAILEYIDKQHGQLNISMVRYVEQAFIYDDGEVVYAGKPDCIIDNTVYDYKITVNADKITDNHIYMEQISAYATAFGCSKAVILAVNDGEVVRAIELDKDKIKAKYSAFKSRILQQDGVVLEKDKHLHHLCEEYEASQLRIKELEKQAKVFKEQIFKELDALHPEGFNGYKIANCSITSSESARKTLKKAYHDAFLDKHPNWFDVKLVTTKSIRIIK